jgi:uncharacterized tellurite resistance protein B-like protein
VLDAIKSFFGERIAGQGAGQDPLALASAALMFEVMRADSTVDASERARLRVLLRREYDLSTKDLQEIEALFERELGEDDLFEFAALVNDAWGMPRRVELVEKLWMLAWADGTADGLEAGTIRRICAMLEVSEDDFSAARKRAARRLRVPQ